MHPVHLASRGHMAWDESLLAVGSSSLSLYSLQQNKLTELQTLPSRQLITSMEWSKTSEAVLASGSDSGSVSFYKKSALLSDPGKSFIKEDKIIDNMSIGSLQFCPSKPNLLAIGANELFIYNLDAGLNGRDSSRYVFKLGKNNMEGKRLTSIAWNPQVQYILAAATQNCAASVWDLRGNQTLFNVHDANYLNKSFCSGIAWNPDIPTQFIMAYDDPTTPNLQIWDLRKHEQPVKELKTNHQTGITALSWCPFDSSIFASSDRSGFTNFWSFKQCQTFLRLTHSVNSVPCSIKWVPKQPGLVSFGFESGEIEIRNIYTPPVETGTRTASSDDGAIVARPQTVHTPLWVLRKNPCSFAYHGKVYTTVAGTGKIAVNQIRAENSALRSKVEKPQSLYKAQKTAELCRLLSEKASEVGKLQWEMISSKISGNISSVISLLGFDRRSIEVSTEKQTGKKRGAHEEVPSGGKESFNDTFSFVDLSAVDAVDFFNKAGAKHEEVKQQVESLKSEPEFVQTIMETISKNVNWDEGLEKLIRENIILGNLEAAIDCALVCGRTAEALIIAAQGGPELFNITQEAVLSSSKDKFLKNMLLPLLSKNLSSIIDISDIAKWKEVLSIMIINNSKAALIAQFAEKLEQAGLAEAAEACYLYSGNSERVIESWVRQFRQAVAEGQDYEDEVVCLFYKALLYSESFAYAGSELLEKIYLEYLNLVFRNGLVDEGFEMMKLLKAPKFSMAFMVFFEKHMKAQMCPTKAPWKVMNVQAVKVKAKESDGKKPERSSAREPAVESRSKLFSGDLKGQPAQEPPVRTAFPQPVRTAFAQPVKSAFSEPAKAAFAEPVKGLNEGAKTVAKADRPPPPPVFEKNLPQAQHGPPSSTEIKKSPFGENKSQAPPSDHSRVAPPPGPPPGPPPNLVANSATPPPPPGPVRREAKLVDPPPPRAEKGDTRAQFGSNPRPAEHTAHHEPIPEPMPAPDVIRARTEERKVAPPVASVAPVPAVPAVPKSVPPPRPAVVLPGKLGSRPFAAATTATSAGSDGLDLSSIPQSLMGLASKWESAVNDWSVGINPKILKDVECKLQEFFNKLKSQEINEPTLSTVNEMTEALETGDFATANKHYLDLCSKNWEENKNWLTAMKRIIQGKQSSRGK